MVDYENEDHEYWEWVESEKRAARSGFHRSDQRSTRRKRLCDCGHWIDAGEPYRYQVWVDQYVVGLQQRLDCEFCARRDNRY